jgi:hypothetical protein
VHDVGKNALKQGVFAYGCSVPKMTRIASLYSGPIELDEQAILSVICHSDLGQSETMSTPALADEATNQQHKRHRKENSAEEEASSNTRKRQKHEGGLKSAEFYEALEEELNAKSYRVRLSFQPQGFNGQTI